MTQSTAGALKTDESSSAPKEDGATQLIKAKSKPTAKAAARSNSRTAVTNSVRESAKNVSAGIKKAAQGPNGKKAEKPSSDSGSAAE